MLTLLEPLEAATKLLSAASYPTMGDIRLVFLSIQEYLNMCIEKEEFSQNKVAELIYQKIEEYWTIMDKPSVISAILDPRTKLKIFDQTNTVDAKKAIQEAMNQYIQDRQALLLSNNVSENPIKTARKFFWNLRNRLESEELLVSNYNPRQESTTTDTNELDNYLMFDTIEEDTNPLDWWKSNQKTYPILSKMASDYLSIQATSVACEHAFSIASNTISRTCNRLHSETARACLCVKSWITNGVGEN